MFERVKNNLMVKNGLEIYSIAKEVYNIVNNKDATDVNKSLNSAEEIYVAAVHRVTERSEKKIKTRPDYKLVHFSAQTYRKVRSVAGSVKKIAKKRYNRVRSFVAERVKNVKLMIKRGYSTCKQKFLDNRFINTEKMQSLKLQLDHYQAKTNDIAMKIYTQVDNFVGFNECKNYSLKLSSDVKQYINDAKNKVIDGKNVIVDVATNNIASATKVATYSYYFAKQMMVADVNALMTAIETNKLLITAYLKNLELEMYYSPDQSIKLIETIKQYANNILNKDASDAVSHSSAQVYENPCNGDEQVVINHA